MLQELEQDSLRREMDAARADPKKHRLTRNMGKASLSHRYWPGGRTKRGDSIYFCVADCVNAAGYVLTWREVHYRKPRKVRGQGKVVMNRDQWAARKTHRAAVKLAQARAARSLSRLSR
jgi:hypothetical protein